MLLPSFAPDYTFFDCLRTIPQLTAKLTIFSKVANVYVIIFSEK